MAHVGPRHADAFGHTGAPGACCTRCRSLEEIPAQEYEPEYTAPKTAETKAPRHRAAERFRTAPEKDAIAAHAITDAPEEAATIAEEFDLRQAVIYSEILKSRFDEE